jgi:hypothetical protein
MPGLFFFTKGHLSDIWLRKARTRRRLEQEPGQHLRPQQGRQRLAKAKNSPYTELLDWRSNWVDLAVIDWCIVT